MKAKSFTGVPRDLPFGFIAVGLAVLLLGLCVFLPFEIYINGIVSYISPTGIAMIAVCSLFALAASVGALIHPNLGQKLLGLAAAVFSAWILTLSVVRVLQHLPT